MRAAVARKGGAQRHSFVFESAGATQTQNTAYGDLALDDAIHLTRAVLIGADKEMYPVCTPWNFSGHLLWFTCDDTKLPDSAIPYVIDPTLSTGPSWKDGSSVTMSDQYAGGGYYFFDYGGWNAGFNIKSIPSNVAVTSVSVDDSRLSASLTAATSNNKTFCAAGPPGSWSVNGSQSLSQVPGASELDYSFPLKMGWYLDGTRYYCTWSINGIGSLWLWVTYTVPLPLSITTSSLPSGVVGAAYSTTLTASGGNGPYSWSISSGSLPAGLALSSGGVISGTPTAIGATSVTVKVADTSSHTATSQFTLTVKAGTVITAYNQSTGTTVAGLTIAVDSTTCSSPCQILDGQPHQIRMPSPETAPGSGGSAIFVSWSDGGANPHTIQAGASVTVNFTTYYQFTGNPVLNGSASGGGSVVAATLNSQGVAIPSGSPPPGCIVNTGGWLCPAGTSFWVTGQAGSGSSFITLGNGYKQQGIVMNSAVMVTGYFSNNVLAVTTPSTPQVLPGNSVTAHYSGGSTSTSGNGTTYNGGYGSDGTTLGSISCYSLTEQILASISNVSNPPGNISFDANFLAGASATPGQDEITCSCNYFECSIDLAVNVEPTPLPTVIITGPQGIPQNGSDTFSVSVSGTLLDGPVTITLATNSGTGSATFAGGATSTTISTAGTQNLTVNGVQVSSTANNITIGAYYQGELLTSQQFSVVSVSIKVQASNPPVQKDAELTNFLTLVGGSGATQGGLGAEIFYNSQPGPYSCAVGVELVGAVTPSNYAGLVTLKRNIVSTAIFDGQNSDTRPDITKPPGADNSVASLVDNVVGAGGAGQVFDLDPPSVGAISVSGAPERYRTNFQEYAVLGDTNSSTAKQVGAFYPYYVAVSCGGTLNAPALDTTVPGDNVAASGTIPLTWNLIN
jgi:hypothetical protein